MFKLSHWLWCPILLFAFSSHFSRGNFYWPFIKLIPLSLAIFYTLICPSKLFFISVIFFSPTILFFLILEFISLCLSITLLTFPICSCVLLAFYFWVLNILIVVMLNFPYYNSYSFALSVTFWYLLCLFWLWFLLHFNIPYDFLLKTRWDVQELRLKRPLVQGFVLICQGVWLCLMFVDLPRWLRW